MRRNTVRAKPTQRHSAERVALLSARAFIDDMRSRYRELEKQTGASITVHRALDCIAGHPGLSASALATALGMKRPAVSHLLKGLTENGWIERLRTKADQRSVQLHLTAAGKLVVEATAGSAVGTLRRSMSRLTDAEVTALSLGLPALLRELPPHPRTVTERLKRAR
jgi:MarR family transcriptional regulator, organic hydroperoxide resistance regulator